MATTEIKDTLYLPDGTTLFNGDIQIQWPTFQSSDGQQHPQGQYNVVISNGVLDVFLEPTDNTAPSGIFYTVIYNLRTNIRNAPLTEEWSVPTSSTPVNLEIVRGPVSNFAPQSSIALVSCDYNFPPVSPGSSLAVGSNSITIAPLPQGIAVGNSLYISGGTGTAEVVPITGVSGNTIIVTCAYIHTGTWTIQSATGGLQEAIAAAPSIGGKVIINCNTTLYTNVVDMGKGVVLEKYGNVTITNTATYAIYNALNISTPNVAIITPANNSVNIRGTGPATTTDGNFVTFQANVNNYPSGNFFGAGTLYDDDAVRGAIVNGTGVAGYSLNNTPNNSAAVGVYGQGNIGVDNTSTWGANFVALNSDGSVPAVGHTIVNVYGLEVDVNIYKKSDGTDPGTSTIGIYVVGGSNVGTVNNFIGIRIDSPGVYQTPRLHWNSAISTDDDSADIAFSVGCLSPGNGTGSQTIAFRSRSSTGTNNVAKIFADNYGNLQLTPSIGSNTLLSDGNFNVGAGLIPSGSTPYFEVNNRFVITTSITPATSSAPGIAGTIAWDANYIYVCIAANTWKRVAIATW